MMSDTADLTLHHNAGRCHLIKWLDATTIVHLSLKFNDNRYNGHNRWEDGMLLADCIWSSHLFRRQQEGFVLWSQRRTDVGVPGVWQCVFRQTGYISKHSSLMTWSNRSDKPVHVWPPHYECNYAKTYRRYVANTWREMLPDTWHCQQWVESRSHMCNTFQTCDTFYLFFSMYFMYMYCVYFIVCCQRHNKRWW